MTKILDWCIDHNKSFRGWTHYEKWEYREEVIEGMKDKACGLCAYLMIGGAMGILLAIGLGAI